MANPARGEVGFEADGKQYILKYGTNALAALEQRLKVKVKDLGGVLQDPEIGQIRAVFAIGLQAHHKGLSEEEAGDVMDAAGGLMAAAELLQEAVTLAFPQGEAKAGTEAAS